jgi:hypothetical protein
MMLAASRRDRMGSAAGAGAPPRGRGVAAAACYRAGRSSHAGGPGRRMVVLCLRGPPGRAWLAQALHVRLLLGMWRCFQLQEFENQHKRACPQLSQPARRGLHRPRRAAQRARAIPSRHPLPRPRPLSAAPPGRPARPTTCAVRLAPRADRARRHFIQRINNSLRARHEEAAAARGPVLATMEPERGDAALEMPPGDTTLPYNTAFEWRDPFWGAGGGSPLRGVSTAAPTGGCRAREACALPIGAVAMQRNAIAGCARVPGAAARPRPRWSRPPHATGLLPLRDRAPNEPPPRRAPQATPTSCWATACSAMAAAAASTRSGTRAASTPTAPTTGWPTSGSTSPTSASRSPAPPRSRCAALRRRRAARPPPAACTQHLARRPPQLRPLRPASPAGADEVHDLLPLGAGHAQPGDHPAPPHQGLARLGRAPLRLRGHRHRARPAAHPQ